MWFIECDSNLLKGKRLWLRPGTSHLLGRTRGDADTKEHVQYIDHKSVSRKHLIIAVDPVQPGDSSHLHNKTKLTVTDGSKLGTYVDGHKIVKESKVLDKKEQKIILGSYEIEFRIIWAPRVLSFTSLSKSSKRAADPLATQRALLESLDIKVISEYVTQYTTHAVNKKRNTAAVLQALVNGRHVVTEAFVDAIAKAAQRSHVDATGIQALSLLEKDFETYWPRELGFLPGPGAEPNPRPEKDPAFLPNEARAEMFARYTFIFCDTAQHETLMPVVTGGGGKALLRAVEWNSASADDMVDYVKEVAGKKGAGAFKLSQHTAKGGVIVVRTGDKSLDGVSAFYQAIDLALDQRSIEQNEFLDAILEIDAASLKRPLEVEIVDESVNLASAPARGELPDSPSHARALRRQSSLQSQPSAPAKDEPSGSSQPAAPSTRRKAPRIITQSRFTGFDDFDPSQITKRRSSSPAQSVAGEPSQAQPSHEMDIDSQPQALATQKDRFSQQPVNRKRPADTRVNNTNYIDDMLVGAAAMKKRKLEEQKSGKSGLTQGDGDEDEEEIAASRAKKRKEEAPPVDYKGIMKKQSDEEERRRQEDEENLHTVLGGMDVNEIRNLAKIEEMDIVPRPQVSRAREVDDDSRWDPAWNGRTNFKKFKKSRPGQDNGAPTRGPQRRRVIVGMEQYKAKTYGMGEDYWLEPESNQSRKKDKRKSQSTSQSQSQARTLANDSGPRSSAQGTPGTLGDDASPGGRLGERIRNSRLQDAEAEEAEDASLLDVASGPRVLQSQTQRSMTSQNKRPAAEPLEGAATKKRQTKIGSPIRLDDSDDDDDALKFRRRRRG